MRRNKILGYIQFWIIWSLIFTFFNVYLTTSCPPYGTVGCFQLADQNNHLGWPIQYLDPPKITERSTIGPSYWPDHEGKWEHYGLYKLGKGEVDYFRLFVSGQLFGFIMSLALTAPAWVFYLIGEIRYHWLKHTKRK